MVPYAFSVGLATATGFVVRVKGVDLLVTNYHVLSGRHPDTGEFLPKVPAAPDRLLIPVLWRRGPRLTWWPLIQSLTEGPNPLWIEHPDRGRRFDVVALPIEVPPQHQVVPYDIDPGPSIALHMASEVAVVGFPEGMASSGLTAIWKAGTVASEIDLSIEENGYFWIDSNTRRGMSGAPVVARRFGAALMEDGSYAVGAGISDRTLGVYAGRAFDAPDMTLGRVWGWNEVQRLLEHAAEEVLLRKVLPKPTWLGFAPNQEVGMPVLDVKKATSVNVPTPNGIESKTVSVAQLVRELGLSDERFGISLERVRMAAAIDAAIDSAEKGDGKLSLDASQYALIAECIEKPSKGFNPLVARQVLPLLDYILDSGKNG